MERAASPRSQPPTRKKPGSTPSTEKGEIVKRKNRVGKPCIIPKDLASAIATQIGRTFGCPRNQAAFESCGRGNCTASLQTIFNDLGRERGMRPVYQRKNVEKSVPQGNCRPHEKQHDKSEFLFDHVWFDSGEQMTLAAEIEFSRYGYNVLDDFRKLIYAKSPLKVMVFSDHRGTKETLEQLEYEVCGFRPMAISVPS
jgi:hypothetical protein